MNIFFVIIICILSIMNIGTFIYGFNSATKSIRLKEEPQIIELPSLPKNTPPNNIIIEEQIKTLTSNYDGYNEDELRLMNNK